MSLIHKTTHALDDFYVGLSLYGGILRKIKGSEGLKVSEELKRTSLNRKDQVGGVGNGLNACLPCTVSWTDESTGPTGRLENLKKKN